MTSRKFAWMLTTWIAHGFIFWLLWWVCLGTFGGELTSFILIGGLFFMSVRELCNIQEKSHWAFHSKKNVWDLVDGIGDLVGPFGVVIWSMV